MKNEPTYDAYHTTDRVQDGSEKKGGFFTKIGAAWPHSDRKGYTVACDMIPLNGRIVLRLREERQTETAKELEQAPTPQTETEPTVA